MTSAIQFVGDLLRLPFDRFGPDEYGLFLKAKRLPESRTLFDPVNETYVIEAPARFAAMLGVELPKLDRPALDFSAFLFDDQVEITGMALDAKRFAVWSDCGLGKTLIELEFARHVIHRTGGRVLIITLNEIIPQYIEEAFRFYGDALPIVRINSRAELREWCKNGPGHLAITNYEKMNPESLETQEVTEMRHLAAIILDESSRLKTGGGKQKWALIKSCKGIEYKLSCTATPAPNDIMEFASQASFLEKMRNETDIIWTYFVRDPKTHRWTVKRHARKAFFEFMSGWSIYVRNPKRYGWRQGMEEVPEPIIQAHEIESTEEQRAHLLRLAAQEAGGQGMLFYDKDTNAIQRAKLSQVAKGFVYLKDRPAIALPDKLPPRRKVEKQFNNLASEMRRLKFLLKIYSPTDGEPCGISRQLRSAREIQRIESKKPAYVADLIYSEVAAGLQVLVWTVFDAESNLIAEALAKTAGAQAFDLLTGKTKDADRLTILERFRKGESRVLISRANMLGYGMNFQNCGSMIFSGWTDSFESYYQALRRAYRYGQKKRLRVHIPCIKDLEGDQLENIFRKESAHNSAIEEMEANYVTAKASLRGAA